MKVYFGTSPRIKEKFPKEVAGIYRQIKKLGYTHTSEWVDKLDPKSYDLEESNKDSVTSIKKADICVFEASLPSLSVGYLVNFSLYQNKQVVVLTQNKNPSYLFSTIKSNGFYLRTYSQENLDEVLAEVMKKAAGGTDVRFNFFVSPKILGYLDWVAQKRMIPRSVFLRDLIEREMKKDKEFKG